MMTRSNARPVVAAALVACWLCTPVLADGPSVLGLFPAPGEPRACIDTPLYVTFDQPIELADSGAIRIYGPTAIPVDTIDLADPASRVRMIGGAGPYHYYPVIVTDTWAAIYPHQALEYGRTYLVVIDPGVFRNPAGESPGIKWTFSTRHAAPLEGVNLTVAGDGSGDFCTVQGAIDFVPPGNTQPITITVGAGTYTEINYVSSNKPFLTVRGEDRDGTVIQYANNNNFNAGNLRAMFGVDAPDFTLENITLHNTTPYLGSQAEAFRGNNQRILLRCVNLMSFQDTLLLQGTGFVTDSYIEGDVDFMWGYGTVFFQNSELKALHTGYYTMIRNDQAHNGNVYVNCVLSRAPDLADETQYLARIDPTVFPFSQVVYINCAMDTHVRSIGWLLNTTPINDCSQAPNIQFWEYNSTDLNGDPIDVSQRLPCSRQLSDDEAAQWSDPTFVLGGWDPNAGQRRAKASAGN